MAVSKRLRFEILRRDNHACQMCGGVAPNVALTVDHVVPVALGGSDDPTNLQAACLDCNSGKSSISPDSPMVAGVSRDARRWTLAMQSAAAIAQADREWRECDRNEWLAHWETWTYSPAGGDRHTFPLPADWGPSIDRFVSLGLGLNDLMETTDTTMHRSIKPGRTIPVDDHFRYFCGISWRLLTERQQTAAELLAAIVED